MYKKNNVTYCNERYVERRVADAAALLPMVKNELTDSSYGVGSVGVMGEAAAAFGDFEEVVWMRGVVLCDARARKAYGKRTLARAYYEYRARIGRHHHPPPRHAP